LVRTSLCRKGQALQEFRNNILRWRLASCGRSCARKQALMRKLAEACENASEGLQDFTCLHMGNGPNRTTRIPAKFKPSRDFRLSAELRVAVCHASVLSGWVRGMLRLTTCMFLPMCHSPSAQQPGGRTFCALMGRFFVMCLVLLLLGPPGDVTAEGTWAWGLSPCSTEQVVWMLWQDLTSPGHHPVR